jgi:hypothetical protein
MTDMMPTVPTTPSLDVAGAVSGVTAEIQQALLQQPPTAPAPAPVPKPHPTGLADGNGAEITSDKLKERLDRATEKAQNDLLAKLGFKSFEEAQAEARRRAEEFAKQEETRRATLSNEQRLQEELDRERRARIELEVKTKAQEDALDQQRLREEVQRIALSSGVRPEEVDYAIFEFGRLARSVTEAELDKLDPSTFFSSTLKAKKPHIYGQAASPPPATTGLGADNGSLPAPIPPKTPEGTPAGKTAFDMTPKEWHDHLRKLGAGV